MEKELKPMIGTQEVCDYLNINKKTLMSLLESDRGFPKPFEISPKLRRWDKEEIISWVGSQR